MKKIISLIFLGAVLGLVPAASSMALSDWNEPSDVRTRSIEKRKKHRQIKKDQDKQKKALRKEELRQEKEERKRRKKIKEQERKQAREQELQEKQRRQEFKKQERREKEQKQKTRMHALVVNEQKIEHDQIKRLAKERTTRMRATQEWQKLHDVKVREDYQNGRYADLYKSPAWPTQCTFSDDKAVIDLSLTYNHATDAYNNDGKRTDVSRLEFGYDPIRLEDISLAYKLAKENKVSVPNANLSDGYITYYKKNDISFAFSLLHVDDKTFTVTPNGEVDHYHANLGLARYIWNNNVLVGVNAPLVHVKNDLKLNIASSGSYTKGSNLHESIAQESSYLLNSLLEAKGFKEIGGSETGIGDVSVFVNIHTGARTFERVMAGFKATFDTGKNADPNKLWGPALGSGHTQFSAYTSMLVDYNRAFNPHCFIEATYGMPSHKNLRVPVRVKKEANLVMVVGEKTFNYTNATDSVTEQALSLGGVVKHVAGQTFNEFDTKIKGFADQVHSVKIVPGMNFKVRVGNMVEKFIFRRGFLDVYYDLNVKFKDAGRGLNVQDYDLSHFGDGTNSYAHKVGAEFSYQFDASSRFKAGAGYTFEGHNAPKNFELSTSLGYSF